MTQEQYNQWWFEYYQELEEIMVFLSNVGWDEIGFAI
jgi:hypothetical protein